MQARLPEVLEYIQERKTHNTAAHYRAEAAAEAGGVAASTGPVGVVLGDVPFPPGMEVVLDPGLGLGSGIIIPADLRQAPPPVQLDPEHTTHVPAQRYQEICQRFRFARSYIDRLYSERHELIIALCPVYLPEGMSVDQGLPLEPFLNRVLSTDLDLPWIRACCFLLLNVYAMKNRQPGIGDFRLLTVVRDMQLYHRTVFMMIMGETMCWVRDIALHIFNVHHRGCPLLLQAWALDKLSLIPPVPARLIPTYGPAVFQSRSWRRFDFGDNPTIRWTCP
ncbi:hypothetical protein JCGZ_20322 [Jatropha curcas]|uniref:Aminotransferase-like plant mobile domain-containing protein n=1 Tax=Jatropha curcas TaxID=180498 RepID=A0A067JW92_JATCU|nr:hypothetical protein JCGZ_20322 [Jatropha curcas]